MSDMDPSDCTDQRLSGWERPPFRAVFEPKRTGDLKRVVREWLATYKPTVWEYLWIITEEDGGPYVGQWACGVHRPDLDSPVPPFVWVPEEDLRHIEDTP